MKVRLEIDDSLNEDEIVIHTKEYTEELKQLLSNFKSKPSIQFFKQDTEYYLDLDTILFFESDNGKVYAHTAINDNLNMYINDHLRMYTSDYTLI